MMAFINSFDNVGAPALATQLEQRDQPTVEHETLLNEGGKRLVNVFP
ncbi:hypothetical protein [Bradyrhizobium sp. LVM 105]|nr:hypothetical protein [Bradyrhizobium sp. LVM 105]